MFFEEEELSKLNDGEIKLMLTGTAKENPQRQYLPAYYFDIVEIAEKKIVGSCDLRIGENEGSKWGGNIGYTVFPHDRGHHFAEKACRLLFKLAELHGLKELRITCSPENIASNCTCRNLGLEFLGKLPLPPESDMYKGGRPESCIYVKRF